MTTPHVDHGTGMLGTFADWMGYDEGLAEHEEAFRAKYGPTADQMMDVATFNLRLADLGIEYAVVEKPPEPPPPEA
jgi:Pyruvate/2-oxoacid:ferredoxin oxidoreductase gamma subunit